MKQPHEYLADVVWAIAARDRSHDGGFLLGILDGNVVCQPGTKKPEPELKIGRYRNYTLDKGFTGAEWDRITATIVDYWRKKT